MKCHFCQQNTIMHYDRMIVAGDSNRVAIWKCYNCKHRVRHVYLNNYHIYLNNYIDEEKDLLHICISLKMNGKNYSVQLNPLKNTCKISELVISSERDSIISDNLITSLDFIPNITPDNIEEKLPTYILLS